jgi:SAM-dependent methyltransferase
MEPPTPETAPGHQLRFSRIAHAGRTILGPYGAADSEALLDVLALAPGSRALDVGCGKADLLVRLARRGVTGIGIDRNAAFVAAGRALAREAGVADLVELRVAEAEADGAGLPRDLDLAVCIGATQALGGPVEAPGVLAGLVRPGGLVVIGEGYWRVPPEPAWLEEFGVEPGELRDAAGTLARMTSGGLVLVTAREAGTAAWDAYEDAYAGAVERWATANPDDPDRNEFLERAAFFRSTWARWRRDAMGFVTAVLRRPVAS